MIIFKRRFFGGSTPLTHARIAHAKNWHLGTVSASTTASDYYAEGASNSLTFEKWKPTTVPANWATDFGAEKSVNYCCIGAHRLAGSVVVVQSWDGSSWVDQCDETEVTDNSAIMVLFDKIETQKMRLSIVSGSPAVISVIRFGLSLDMPQPFYSGHAPMEMARQTKFMSNYSDTGEFLGRSKKRTFLQSSYSWTHLQASWIREYWPDAQLGLENEPFFIAWRPDTFGECHLCVSASTPIPTNSGGRDFMSVMIEARAYAHD